MDGLHGNVLGMDIIYLHEKPSDIVATCHSVEMKTGSHLVLISGQKYKVGWKCIEASQPCMYAWIYAIQDSLVHSFTREKAFIFSLHDNSAVNQTELRCNSDSKLS